MATSNLINLNVPILRPSQKDTLERQAWFEILNLMGSLT